MKARVLVFFIFVSAFFSISQASIGATEACQSRGDTVVMNYKETNVVGAVLGLGGWLNNPGVSSYKVEIKFVPNSVDFSIQNEASFTSSGIQSAAIDYSNGNFADDQGSHDCQSKSNFNCDRSYYLTVDLDAIKDQLSEESSNTSNLEALECASARLKEFRNKFNLLP